MASRVYRDRKPPLFQVHVGHFTKSVQNKTKANSMEKSKPRDTQRQNCSHYLTNSGEIICKRKDWKVMENMLKPSNITAFVTAEDRWNLPELVQ